MPPPPPIIFERLKLPQQIIYRRKENLSESPNHQKYWENILVSRFYEQFSRNRRNLGHFRKFEKISNSQNMDILYIILKHVIWRFQIYNLFREIFQFREDKSNNVFREIRKWFRKTAKFAKIELGINKQIELVPLSKQVFKQCANNIDMGERGNKDLLSLYG